MYGKRGKDAPAFGKFGKDAPGWKGGKITDSDGYIRIYCRTHKYKDCHGYVREHRLILEKFLGRYITMDEVVHHKDGNRSNNNLLNLQLVTKAEHNTIHKKRGSL